MPVYRRPAALEEALAALAEPHTVLAGGTDFYPARVGRAIEDAVLDITNIAALRGISAGSFLVCSNVVDAPATQWTADEHRAAFLTAAPVALSALLSEPKPK